MNQITYFADSSNVYGSDLCEMRELREFVGGHLNSTRTFHGGLDLLPQTDENAECKSASGLCFEAGDARNSEQPVLAALHTIFMRYHNKQSSTGGRKIIKKSLVKPRIFINDYT